jgi:prevent-host-death family protein
MKTVNVHEAKTTLSDLIARAEAGEEIVIARANKPAVRLVPVAARRERRVLGLNAAAGFSIADDFDAPLQDEVLWYDDVPSHRLQQAPAGYRKPRSK